MMMSATVTRAAIRTVRPMIAGIGAWNRSWKFTSDKLCWRLLVNGLTVQNAVTSITTRRRQVDHEEPRERRREREGGPQPRPAPERRRGAGHHAVRSALAGRDDGHEKGEPYPVIWVQAVCQSTNGTQSFLPLSHWASGVFQNLIVLK